MCTPLTFVNKMNDKNEGQVEVDCHSNDTIIGMDGVTDHEHDPSS